MARGKYERTTEHRRKMSAIFTDRIYSDAHKKAISDGHKRRPRVGMNNKVKIRQQFVVVGGILDGTIIEPILAFIGVKYPHRKTKDLYVPPMKTEDKEIKTWHCCQESCPNPDFEGGLEELVEHLMLHKGRLLRPWNKRQQLKSPMPAIKLPPNPCEDKPEVGHNEDRRFCLNLYIDDVKRALRKQGLEIIEQQ